MPLSILHYSAECFLLFPSGLYPCWFCTVKFARKAKGVILGETKVLMQLEVNPKFYRLPMSISVHYAENEFQLNCSPSKALTHLLYIIPQSHFTQS